MTRLSTVYKNHTFSLGDKGTEDEGKLNTVIYGFADFPNFPKTVG